MEITLGFICIMMAFLPTKGNAKQILPGYNTMSGEARQGVDMDGYLRWLKRYNISLGMSLIVIGLIIRQFRPDLADIFAVVYLVVGMALMFFLGQKYIKHSSFGQVFSRVIAFFMVAGAAVVVYFSLIRFKESTLVFEGNELKITGIYGINLLRGEIQKVALVSALPRITSRTHGFNGGSFRKGDFRTREGKSIKLFVNLDADRFLLISTEEKDIYFSSEQADMQEIYNKVRLWKEARAPQVN